MSDTPRTDAQIIQHQVAGIWQDYVHADAARILERELNSVKAQLAQAEDMLAERD